MCINYYYTVIYFHLRFCIHVRKSGANLEKLCLIIRNNFKILNPLAIFLLLIDNWWIGLFVEMAINIICLDPLILSQNFWFNKNCSFVFSLMKATQFELSKKKHKNSQDIRKFYKTKRVCGIIHKNFLNLPTLSNRLLK